jgi:periplasmic protein TonB
MFDAVAHRRCSLSQRRFLAAPLSVVLHGAVIGGVVAASSWFVGEVPEPPIPLVFYEPASSAPPARAGAAIPLSRDRRPAGKVRLRTPVVLQPRAASLRTVIEDAPAVDLPPAIGEASGQGAGWETVPGGLDRISSPVGGAAVETEPPPIVPGPEVDLPVLVDRVEPVYPETARRARLSGFVVLEAIISTRGRVEDLRVLRSADPLLDAAAVEAVSRWRYRPATLGGRAVRVYLTVTVDFTLR